LEATTGGTLMSATALARFYPLHHACAVGSLDIVRDMLDKGASVDEVGPYKSTPLHIASFFNRIEIVQLLLQRTAKPNILDQYNRTPLIAAVFKEHLELMEVLISAGADVDFAPMWLPIHAAARFNKVQAMTILLRHNANISLVDAKQCNALHVACKMNHFEMVQLLLPHLSLNSRDKGGRTPFLCAAKRRSGNMQLIKFLLESGSNINDHNLKGNTALHYSILHTDVTLLETLLDLGERYNLDLNANTNNGNTPLHLASTVGFFRGAELLLAKGAATNVRNHDTVFPFYLAARYGHTAIVDLFLERNPEEALCRSALYCAAKGGHKDIIQKLIARGITVNFLKKHNFTPLHRAAEKGSEDVVRILLRNKAEIEAKTRQLHTPVHLSVLNGHINVLQALIENGAELDAKTSEKNTPMLIAAQRGYTNIVELLYKHGVNLNRVVNKQCALSIATCFGREEVVQKLVQLGANVNLAGQHQVTSLHIACREGYMGIIRSLLRGGGNVESVDKKGRTPLHYASVASRDTVVQFLRGLVRTPRCKVNNQNVFTCSACSVQYCVDCAIGKISCDMCKSYVCCRFCEREEMRRIGWKEYENVCTTRCYKICVAEIHLMGNMAKFTQQTSFGDCLIDFAS
jgi:ankyrin repeat protein